MIDARDVEICMDMVYAEFKKQIRAQSEAVGLDDSQIRDMEQLFIIVDQYGKAVLARLEDLEIERLEKMAVDYMEVKE